MERNGMQQKGTEYNRKERNGIQRKGKEWSRKFKMNYNSNSIYTFDQIYYTVQHYSNKILVPLTAEPKFQIQLLLSGWSPAMGWGQLSVWLWVVFSVTVCLVG